MVLESIPKDLQLPLVVLVRNSSLTGLIVLMAKLSLRHACLFNTVILTVITIPFVYIDWFDWVSYCDWAISNVGISRKRQ